MTNLHMQEASGTVKVFMLSDIAYLSIDCMIFDIFVQHINVEKYKQL